MKKQIIFLFLMAIIMGSCTASKTTKTISSVDSNEASSYDGWAPQDVKQVTRYMVSSIKESPYFKLNPQKPFMIVSEMRNDTDEMIQTRILTQHIQAGLSKEGLQSIGEDQLKEALMQSNSQKSDLYDPSKSSQIGKTVSAGLVLQGSISNMRKTSGNSDIVFYYIMFRILNLSTGKIVWTDQMEIGKKAQKTRIR